jgi:virginiamycin B lyase
MLIAADPVQASPADRGARSMPFVPALGFFHDLVDGSDGAIWVRATAGIGRVTAGLKFTAFRTPPEFRFGYGSQIAWSADGTLWSVEGPDLVRMTRDGQFTAFRDVATRASHIIPRPDGSMWFSDPPGHRIRAITPDGAVRDIEARLPSDAQPTHMAATTDGSVWFSDARPDGGLGRVRPDGTVTRMFYGQKRFIEALAAGPRGDLWFITGQDPSQDDWAAIGRVTPRGNVVSYRLPPYSSPENIAAARDGTVWFTSDVTTISTSAAWDRTAS